MAPWAPRCSALHLASRCASASCQYYGAISPHTVGLSYSLPFSLPLSRSFSLLSNNECTMMIMMMMMDSPLFSFRSICVCVCVCVCACVCVWWTTIGNIEQWFNTLVYETRKRYTCMRPGSDSFHQMMFVV